MSEAMNNFETTVVACSREALTKALSLVQMQHSRFSGFRVDNGVLELFWSVPPSSGIEPREKQTPVQAFIVPLDHVAVLESVIQWLSTVEPKEPKPDIDGSVSKGFRLVSGHEGGWSYVACRIEPVWALHGK